MTRDELNRFVSKLSPEFQKMFSFLDEYIMQEEDTLCEEFQLACAMKDCFIYRADKDIRP